MKYRDMPCLLSVKKGTSKKHRRDVAKLMFRVAEKAFIQMKIQNAPRLNFAALKASWDGPGHDVQVEMVIE